MAKSHKPSTGLLVLSVLHSSRDALADGLNLLEKRFGRVRFETQDIPYSGANEYVEEMGNELERRFFSFERPVERDALVEIKQACFKIEQQLADHVQDYDFRTVNIDPCILSPVNLVMASHREFNHRIYIRDGVFAEIVLVHARGQYVRLPWTHLDFCHDDAVDLFVRMREDFNLVGETKTPEPVR